MNERPARSLKDVVRRLLPKRIKGHRILAGRLKGMRIVTSWHDYPAAITGRTERSLLEWFAENVRPGETWLDVGAHYGYTAMALSRFVGPKGRVFAFEPALRTAGCLAETRRMNRLSQLIVIPMGLANPAALGLDLLCVTRGMADATLAKRPESGRAMEPIVLARLDWLWPQVCRSRSEIHGLKIDVQGMELEALRGMCETLRKGRPKLVLELHTGVDRGALLDILGDAGYERVGTPVEPVLGEEEAQYIDDRSYSFRVSTG